MVVRLHVKEGNFFTPPKRVTIPTWGPPPPCKQALRNVMDWHNRHFERQPNARVSDEEEKNGSPLLSSYLALACHLRVTTLTIDIY